MKERARNQPVITRKMWREIKQEYDKNSRWYLGDCVYNDLKRLVNAALKRKGKKK